MKSKYSSELLGFPTNLLASVCLFLFSVVNLSAQNVSIDPTFNPSDIGFDNGIGPNTNGVVNAMVVLADGKILIGGSFTSYNNVTRLALAKLNSDGTLDAAFDPKIENGVINALVVQTDGKVIIGGTFTSIGGTTRNRIARLNTNGSLDATFNPGAGVGSTVYSLALQADGKIIIGGNFSTYDGVTRNDIVRVNADGSLDTSFSSGTGLIGGSNIPRSIFIQTDGKILIGGSFTSYSGTARANIVRITSTGAIDTSFDPGTGAGSDVCSIAVQTDGKILLGGKFTTYNGITKSKTARINSNGSLDTSYTPGCCNLDVNTLRLLSDGKILIGTDNRVARLNANGTADLTLPTGSGQILIIDQLANGKILIGGSFDYLTSGKRYIGRLNSDGTLDISFNAGTGVSYSGGGTSIFSSRIQADGKILISGIFKYYNGSSVNYFARLNTNGSLDTNFLMGTGPNGIVLAIALQSDGKIIIGGQFTEYNGTAVNRIARLNTDGTLDITFNPGTGANSTINATVIQPDGKILIGGSFTQFNGTSKNGIARISSGGALDGTFSSSASGTTALAIQSDGKVYYGAGTLVRRLTDTGTTDATFAQGTLSASGSISTIAIQSDGKIVVAGRFTTYNTVAKSNLVRVNTDGTIDTNFVTENFNSSTVESIQLLSDAKILVAGDFTTVGGVETNRIVRLNSNGSTDTGFNIGTGFDNTLQTLSIQSDGKILVGGGFTSFNGIGRNRIARLQVAAPVLPTITSFNPTSGLVGATVTITGTNFSTTPASNSVKFNNTAATVTASTATSITTSVPTGATTGKVTVTVGGQTATSSGDFTVTTPGPTVPTITSFNPTSGAVGTTVTITGTNFSTTPANNTVKFNNTTAAVTASSATSITTSVPTGATTGKVTVTVGGQTATSTSDFTVTVAVTEPTTQPTALTFANVTSSSFNASFTAAAGSPAGYIAVRRAGAAPTTDPVDGTAYSLEATLGNGTIAYVGTATSFNQTGLTPATTYHYKIYSYNGSGATINYRQTSPLTGSQATTALSAVQITNQTLPAQAPKSGATAASITVSSTATIATVKFWSKGISEPASAYSSETLTATGTTYTKSLTSAILTDPIGLTYYFEVTDNTQATVLSNTGKTYLQFAATDQTIPNLRFGNQVSSYQIISVPLELTTKTVTSVFDELGAYDKKQWRLFTFSADDNREYPSFSTIDAGKGYWFIARTSTSIAVGEGRTVTADETTPFKLNLSTGWNLIGNPYNFRISWAEVLSVNSTATGVGNLKVFTSGALTDSDVLDRYQGAFVFTDANITLDVPVLRNKSLGGRVHGGSSVENSLTDSHWEVPLYLSRDDLRNELAGIGMHPNAKDEGKDSFDQVSVPLPEGLGFFELQTNHPEVKSAFNKDVVARKENNIWVMNVRRDENLPLTLSWENHFFGVNDQNLVLFDPATHQHVDMKTKTSYRIGKNTKSLWFIYGNKHYVESTLDSEIPQLGDPYPVPAKELVNIPYRIPSGGSVLVNLDVYDLQGRLVEKLVNNEHTSGSYSATWQTETKGMFLVRLKIGTSVQTKKISIQ